MENINEKLPKIDNNITFLNDINNNVTKNANDIEKINLKEPKIINDLFNNKYKIDNKIP